jgi:glutamyl-tRNA synthetase
MMRSVRGRYAPSPTGRLHLGNARTALLAWLHARAHAGAFVMRIEDVDRDRCKPELESALLSDLAWLGLDWDEGPDVGGRFGPYRQSERADLYADALARLETYRCTCTRRELRDATLAPEGSEPIYPGKCRDGPTHPERPSSLRWRTPAGRVEIDDALAGSLVHDVREQAGDFVLRRSDGAWAYQLAVVVDDAAMGITDVVRGLDLWTSTPRQVHLQHALGLSTPRYCHVPLVRGEDGAKLGKRHRAPDLGELRAAGVDARRVIAVLARSLGLVDESVRTIAPSELVGAFDGPALVERLRGRTDGPLDETLGERDGSR